LQLPLGAKILAEKQFFFEKKNQKTFAPDPFVVIALGGEGRRLQRHRPAKVRAGQPCQIAARV
jgi:hypothetical protein